MPEISFAMITFAAQVHAKIISRISSSLFPSSDLQIPSPACTPASDVTSRTDWRASGARCKPLQYPLTDDQLASYKRDGFLVIPGLLADLADEMARQAEALLDLQGFRIKGNLRYATRSVDGEEKINKIDPFIDLAPFWGRLTRDRRICDALASIYDGREPRLFKDKLIYKPPHSPAHGLHQDYNWWQGLPESCLSVSIPIDGSNRANGATCFYPGVHRSGRRKGRAHVCRGEPDPTSRVREAPCFPVGSAVVTRDENHAGRHLPRF